MEAVERRRAIAQRLAQADGPVNAAALAKAFSVSRQIIVGDVALLRAGGMEIFATPRGYILPGEPAGYVRLESYFRERSILGMVVDVTDDVAARRRIEQERDIDLLTGLFSRRAFYRHMDQLFCAPGRIGCGMMVMADADNLKRVNDRYGHENGDRYLRAIADSLRSCTAKNQVLARLSGDEFALFFYGAPDRDTLEAAVEALRGSMAGRTVALTDGTRIPVRFSMGCAFYPEDGENCGALLKCADEAMYRAKKQKSEAVDGR